MKLLTAAETSLWLKEVGHVEDPHGDAEADLPKYHVQFYAPHKYSVIEAFVRVFMANFTDGNETLLQITDCYPLDQAKRYVINRLWTTDGKVHHPTEKPGCLFAPDETETAVALFSLTSCFWWKSYLYSSRDQLVLFNWEGDIWDVWTASEYKMLTLQELVRDFRKSHTDASTREPDGPFKLVPED